MLTRRARACVRGAQLHLKKASSSEEKAAAKATWTAAKQAAWASYDQSIQKTKVAAAAHKQRPFLCTREFWRGRLRRVWALAAACRWRLS